MTREEARKILTTWRPGSDLGGDPDLKEALALASQDVELAEWLRQQGAFDLATRACLRSIPVPPDLADRILARHKMVRARFSPGTPLARWLAAAAAVLLLAVAGYPFRRYLRNPPTADDFATFRSRMVRGVVREYRMDVVTNRLDAIRSFLATHSAPSDFELPPRLAALTPTGGGLLSWQGQPVSMLCLNGGRLGTLFLFVVPSESLAVGKPDTPELAQISRLGTVAWSQQGRTFVLAASATSAELRDFL